MKQAKDLKQGDTIWVNAKEFSNLTKNDWYKVDQVEYFEKEKLVRLNNNGHIRVVKFKNDICIIHISKGNIKLLIDQNKELKIKKDSL